MRWGCAILQLSYSLTVWLQARELADARQKMETTELQSVQPSRFTHGRPTQLHSSETSISSHLSLHRGKSVDNRQTKTNHNSDVLLQHRSHIERYKLRCEELRRVVESVKGMQKLLRSQVRWPILLLSIVCHHSLRFLCDSKMPDDFMFCGLVTKLVGCVCNANKSWWSETTNQECAGGSY